jgi:hypothetical protein
MERQPPPHFALPPSRHTAAAVFPLTAGKNRRCCCHRCCHRGDAGEGQYQPTASEWSQAAHGEP